MRKRRGKKDFGDSFQDVNYLAIAVEHLALAITLGRRRTQTCALANLRIISIRIVINLEMRIKIVIILLKTCALGNQDLNKRTAMVKAMIMSIKDVELTAMKSYSK